MTFSSKFGLAAPSIPKASRFITDTRYVGIEIEQEYDGDNYKKLVHAINSKKIDSRWRVERDGSLRDNGIEFISSILYPGSVEDTIESILQWVSRGTSSWRCAIHVHVDARDLTEDQLFTIGELYSLLEPLIFKWEGNSRHTSRFCIPWYNCIDAIQNVYAGIRGDSRTALRTLERFGKYSALNLMPITRFGSIEFRHLQTTDNVSKLLQYVDLCLSIVEVGASGVNPMLELSSKGPNEFIQELFEGRLDFLIQQPEDYALLWEGVDTANAVNVAESTLSKVPTSRTALGLDYIEMIFNKQEGVRE